MDNLKLMDAVASLIPKLEPFNLSKLELPSDLIVEITRLKDPLIHLLENSTCRKNFELSVDDQELVKELVEYTCVLLDSGIFDENQLRYTIWSLLQKLDKNDTIWSQLEKLDKSDTIWSLLEKLNKNEMELPDNVKGLPSHFGKMFVYCSLFPKGHRFVREFLVNQWLAHDFVQPVWPEIYSQGLEAVGYCYFEEMLSRGLFREPVFVFGDRWRKVFSCEMDPVAHDAACRLAAAGLELSISVFHRRVFDDVPKDHVAFHKNGLSRLNIGKVMEISKYVKTLICFSPHWNVFQGLNNIRLDNSSVFRVLDLSGCQFKELPFCELSSLRYLGLSGNLLLESFSGSLFPSLETLALDGCIRLKSFDDCPSHLMHLYLTTQQPDDLYQLSELTTLELSHCVQLSQFKVSVVLKILRISESPLLDKIHWDYFHGRLEELVLHNTPCLTLDFSSFSPTNLKKLELVRLPIVHLPDWLLSAKGLEYLMIDRCPQLEQLKHLKYVEELYIYNCPNLRSLSVPLDSLLTLRLSDIRNCPNLSLVHKSTKRQRYTRILRMRLLGELRSSADAFDEKSKSLSHSTTSVPGAAAVSLPKIFIDGELQNQKSSTQMQDAQTDTHLLQGVPYFVAKSQKTGLRTYNRWHIIAIAFRAIVKMKVIASLGRQLPKLHCCLFHGDYEFEREKLVQLWMAVDFLGDERMEVTGNLKFELLLEEEYLLPARIDSLTRRRKYKVNSNKISTLLNGMRTIKSKDVCAFLEAESVTIDGPNLWHLSLVSNDFNQATFETLKNFKHLKTLLFVRDYGSSLKQIPSDMFLALKSIQALDLSGSHLRELPNSIGNVIQLRYLDLSFTLIESLPESIDRLCQLQTLKLEGCKHIHILPKGMGKLVDLRYLDFDILGQLTHMPSGIGALTKLRKLSAFVVDSEESASIRELKLMNDLEGSICISGLENASEHDAREATLSQKKRLTQLQLRWNEFKSYSSDKQDEVDRTVRDLKPNACLKELQILYYPGCRLPVWIGSTVFEKLVSIAFIKCANDELQVTLGHLPNLKHLSIIHMYRLPKISRSVHEIPHHAGSPGTFPRLETLIIDGMPNLEEWSGPRGGDFPILSKFIVKQCPKLKKLPFLPYLFSLEQLEISHCRSLTSFSDSQELPSSLQTLVINDCPLLKKKCFRGSEDWYKIEHIQDISIDLEDVRSTLSDGAVSDGSFTGSLSDSDSDSYVLEDNGQSLDHDGHSIHDVNT